MCVCANVLTFHRPYKWGLFIRRQDTCSACLASLPTYLIRQYNTRWPGFHLRGNTKPIISNKYTIPAGLLPVIRKIQIWESTQRLRSVHIILILLQYLVVLYTHQKTKDSQEGHIRLCWPARTPTLNKQSKIQSGRSSSNSIQSPLVSGSHHAGSLPCGNVIFETLQYIFQILLSSCLLSSATLPSLTISFLFLIVSIFLPNVNKVELSYLPPVLTRTTDKRVPIYSIN